VDQVVTESGIERDEMRLVNEVACEATDVGEPLGHVRENRPVAYRRAYIKNEKRRLSCVSAKRPGPNRHPHTVRRCDGVGRNGAIRRQHNRHGREPRCFRIVTTTARTTTSRGSRKGRRRLKIGRNQKCGRLATRRGQHDQLCHGVARRQHRVNGARLRRTPVHARIKERLRPSVGSGRKSCR